MLNPAIRRIPVSPGRLTGPVPTPIPPSYIAAFAVMAAAVSGLMWQGTTIIEALAIVEVLAASLVMFVWPQAVRH